jgi:hypothetical protein
MDRASWLAHFVASVSTTAVQIEIAKKGSSSLCRLGQPLRSHAHRKGT